jgi:hypothetical protein
MNTKKEQYNKKMKDYRDNNKFMNSYHCHNYKRRNRGLKMISVLEYLEYRKFTTINAIGILKSSRFSFVEKWEQYKKDNELIFPEPTPKGNFTYKIKQKILKEF